MRRVFALLLFSISAGLTAQAHAYERGPVVSACKERLGLPNEACMCMADRAEADFNADQFALFSAIVRNDESAAGALRARMSSVDMSYVGARMSKMTEICTAKNKSK